MKKSRPKPSYWETSHCWLNLTVVMWWRIEPSPFRETERPKMLGSIHRQLTVRVFCLQLCNALSYWNQFRKVFCWNFVGTAGLYIICQYLYESWEGGGYSCVSHPASRISSLPLGTVLWLRSENVFRFILLSDILRHFVTVNFYCNSLPIKITTYLRKYLLRLF